ncbi:hypothetical protein MKY37_08450 [Psychrobacillus sp. FSL K6-2836]|uniref:hypothetical protein n=1 Tax=Psychrobacillus sp. FSL K6-2836 TaxID=2921548 RepID=UPI0030FCFF40
MKEDTRSFKNRNIDMPLISAPGGRFPWARLQSPRHSEKNAPAVTRRKDIGQKKLTNVFPAGLSARAPVAPLSVQKTFAVPTGVAALRSNQPCSLYKTDNWKQVS